MEDWTTVLLTQFFWTFFHHFEYWTLKYLFLLVEQRANGRAKCLVLLHIYQYLGEISSRHGKRKKRIQLCSLFHLYLSYFPLFSLNFSDLSKFLWHILLFFCHYSILVASSKSHSLSWTLSSKAFSCSLFLLLSYHHLLPRVLNGVLNIMIIGLREETLTPTTQHPTQIKKP